MKNLCSLILLITAAPFFAFGQNPVPRTGAEGGKSLIRRAVELSDIRGNSARPFRMNATLKHFDADGKPEIATYTEVWFGKLQWRQETVYGANIRTEASDKGGRWLDDRDEVPDWAAEATRLLAFSNLDSAATNVGPIWSEDLEGTRAECVETSVSGDKRILCFAVENGVLLKSGNGGPALDQTLSSCTFRAYERFGDKTFPRYIFCERNGGRRLEVRVLDLTVTWGRTKVRWHPRPHPGRSQKPVRE